MGLMSMPILTHLAPEKDAKAIDRTGIKAASSSHGTPKGVFCMAIMPNYFATHQWLRELKRRGDRTMVAVDFRLRSAERAWFGHYGRPHSETTVGRAIRMLLPTWVQQISQRSGGTQQALASSEKSRSLE
jgi:hypothetical protein